ncbi:PEP-CTERM sorting domain-containing protein [Massilia sp. YMA4]|uniref:PEP-CTERM sorting domain-containing protein n=1 Tax=Massilia sp. YMA4 TaxID=1593482 RepID=UPI001D0CB9B3|nr:PEP-CTERM sorting domain-containing protein [Massilia sp. YMA4]
MNRFIATMALGALLAGSASAATILPTDGMDVTTRVTNLRFEVIDLTPDDGITPTFRLDYSTYQRDINIEHATGHTTLHDGNLGHTDTLQVRHLGSYAAVTWDTPVAGESASSVRVLSGLDGKATTLTRENANIYLGPNARLVVTGDIVQQAAFVGNGAGRGISTVDIILDAYLYSSDEYHSVLDGVTPFNNTETFSLSYDNTDTIDTRWLTLNFKTQAVGISAVPEPSAWLMLGAGLLGVGAVARRRQRG